MLHFASNSECFNMPIKSHVNSQYYTNMFKSVKSRISSLNKQATSPFSIKHNVTSQDTLEEPKTRNQKEISPFHLSHFMLNIFKCFSFNSLIQYIHKHMGHMKAPKAQLGLSILCL